LVLWGGLFFVLGPLHSPGDGDLYWQRWLGELVLRTHHLPAALGNETFTAPGAMWVPQEWLFSVAAAFSANHGLSILFYFFVSLIPIAILATIYLRARAVADAEATGVALLFAGAAMLESFGVRAQVLGWAALAVFLYFLEQRDRRQYLAIPTAIVWANLHASVAIAPMLVLARTIGVAADGGWRALRNGREVTILLGSALALFCTPFGARLPAYAIALAGSPIRHFIQEWQRPGVGDISFVAGALPLAFFIVLGGRATWRDKARTFPAALMFAAMIFASRNIPLFAITAAPLAALALERFAPLTRTLGEKARELEPAALVAICFAMVLSGVELLIAQRIGPPRLPIAAISSLNDGAQHRVLCENFTWCSLALGQSNLRVFIDGRCDPYPLSVWRDYTNVIAMKPRVSPLQRYRVDTVVAGRASRLAKTLESNSAWKQTFQDQDYVVLRRD
jgi:hypothetical protein